MIGCLASPVGDVVCSRFVVDLVWLAGCFGSLICLCTLWCVLLRSGFECLVFVTYVY